MLQTYYIRWLIFMKGTFSKPLEEISRFVIFYCFFSKSVLPTPHMGQTQSSEYLLLCLALCCYSTDPHLIVNVTTNCAGIMTTHAKLPSTTPSLRHYKQSLFSLVNCNCNSISTVDLPFLANYDGMFKFAHKSSATVIAPTINKRLIHPKEYKVSCRSERIVN